VDPPHGAVDRHDRAVRAGQVREVDGHKIVSYGTSSYGYDIRCSREFKIFTNINSTIVDPEGFDAGSFVDFTATSASSRRIRSRWRAPSNTSAFRATC
jgi:dCTP deaminase